MNTLQVREAYVCPPLDTSIPTVRITKLWVENHYLSRDHVLVVRLEDLPNSSPSVVLVITDCDPVQEGRDISYCRQIATIFWGAPFANLNECISRLNLTYEPSTRVGDGNWNHNDAVFEPNTPVVAIKIGELYGHSVLNDAPPTSLPGMDVFTSMAFDSLTCRYVLSTHAARLSESRKYVKSVSARNMTGGQGALTLDEVLCLDSHRRNMAIGRSCVMLEKFDGINKTAEIVWKYEFGAAPTIAYVELDHFSRQTPEIVNESNMTFQWAGAKAILSHGREAMRFTLACFDGQSVAVYERNMEFLPLTRDGKGSFFCERIVASEAVTACLVEAATLLLRGEGDVVQVGIFTPETCAITPNSESGWFVCGGNIDPIHVMSLQGMCRMVDNVFPDADSAIAHLRSNWREFIHVQYEDGAQVAIKSRRAQYAAILPTLPLASMNIHEAIDVGAPFYERAQNACAGSIAEKCTAAAVLSDNLKDKNSLSTYNTCPWFFDTDGEYPYHKLMEIVRTNFHESVTPKGIPYLHIDHDFIQRCEASPPILARCVPVAKLEDLILGGNGQVTGKYVYQSFMERYMRCLISAVYAVYGNGGIAGPNMGSRQLSYVVFRKGIDLKEEYDRLFLFVSSHYDYVHHEVSVMSENDQSVRSHDRTVRDKNLRTSASQVVLSFRAAYNKTCGLPEDMQQFMMRELFITYIINRPWNRFFDILEVIREIYNKHLAIVSLQSRSAGQNR